MQPELFFWLVLAVKAAVTAVFALAAALTAERAGPLMGAMVATLPVSAGPAYLFLALDHDASFIAASAVASLGMNAANALFCAVHVATAQRRGLAPSLGLALGVWLVVASAVRALGLELGGALLLNAAVFVAALPLARRYWGAPLPRAGRRAFDLPLRAGMVVALVLAVVLVSAHVGPTVTGIIAAFPVVLTSLVLIFQPRVGGPATAAITANSIPGLTGYGCALLTLHFLARPAGLAIALTAALAVSVAGNLLIVLLRRRRRVATA